MANPRPSKSSPETAGRLTRWVGSPTSIVIHTIFFAGIFVLTFFGFSADQVLLILTTLVSLEAIYLSIFIQMTVNRNTDSLEEVEEDIEDIQENVDELEDEVKDISEDLEEISEDIDKMHEEDVQEALEDEKMQDAVEKIQSALQQLLKEIDTLKSRRVRK